MTAILIALNVIAGLFLVAVVLLQAGKGADMGAAFGGANPAAFGPATQGNTLQRVTALTAAVFMGTSLALAVVSAREESIFDETSEPAPIAAPAEPVAPVAIPGAPAAPVADAAAPAAEPAGDEAGAAAAVDEAVDAAKESVANAAAEAAAAGATEKAANAADEAVKAVAPPSGEPAGGTEGGTAPTEETAPAE